MDKPFRRYEMLLPLKFNDGGAVPADVLVDTLLELETQFSAVSCESQTTRGFWHHEGESFRDDLVRVYVDVVDVSENRDFFLTFKETLKERFDQIDIWMTTYPLEVL